MLATAFGGRHLQKSSFDVSISRSLVRREHRGGVQADRDRPAARLRKEGERWLGLNGDTARRIGHVLSQGGEFAFVMFAMGVIQGHDRRAFGASA